MKISLEVISGSSLLGVIAGTLDKIQLQMKSDYTCSNIQTLGLAFFLPETAADRIDAVSAA